MEIKSAKGNIEVSWTLYAERNDKYMQNNPDEKKAEIDKTGSFVGKYFRPEYYGLDDSYRFIPRNLLSKKNISRDSKSRIDLFKNTDNLMKLSK
jgi:hypothetical protein